MTIGQDITPGIVTDIESLPAVEVGSVSATNVLLVGQGDLSEGEAEANQPYTLSRASNVRTYFGSDNVISNSINDAFNEGARPVYAVVADEQENTQEITADTGTFDNAPVSEDPESYDAGDYDVEIVMENPEDVTIDDNVLAVNPTTGDYAVNSTPTDLSVTYTSYDYDSAFSSIEEDDVDEIDYIYALNENESVQDSLNDCLNRLESYHEFAIGGVGAASYMTGTEKEDYEARFDNSRMQVFYPSRSADGENIMGAIGGLKARQGINGTTMNKRLQTHDRLIDRIDFNDEETLLGQTTVPVKSSSRGALLVDDVTCVAEDNQEESQMAQGYSRLVVDQVADITHEIERPFVGKLNKPSARGSMQTAIRTAIGFLEEQEAVLNYNVRVHKGDAMTAYVDLQVETVKPLRNIYNTISVGSE